MSPVIARMCVKKYPDIRSVAFGRVFLDISKLREQTGLSRSGLTMIFSGKRSPSLRSVALIAKSLGMTPGQFTDALAAHLSQKHTGA